MSDSIVSLAGPLLAVVSNYQFDDNISPDMPPIFFFTFLPHKTKHRRQSQPIHQTNQRNNRGNCKLVAVNTMKFKFLTITALALVAVANADVGDDCKCDYGKTCSSPGPCSNPGEACRTRLDPSNSKFETCQEAVRAECTRDRQCRRGEECGPRGRCRPKSSGPSSLDQCDSDSYCQDEYGPRWECKNDRCVKDDDDDTDTSFLSSDQLDRCSNKDSEHSCE